MRIIDADNCVQAVDSATLDEDAGTLSNVHTIFQGTPFTNRAVSQTGSRIAIDPKDGNLFVAIGDRSTGDPIPMQAQQTDKYLGKVIHITAEGKPAPGNPALGLPEVWSMGHRTPQGLTFAPDGRLWEVEHGPRGGDELNLIEKGKNYGWPLVSFGQNYDGVPIANPDTRPDLAKPVLYWVPVIAPGNLMFYRGTQTFPQWNGSGFISVEIGFIYAVTRRSSPLVIPPSRPPARRRAVSRMWSSSSSLRLSLAGGARAARRPESRPPVHRDENAGAAVELLRSPPGPVVATPSARATGPPLRP